MSKNIVIEENKFNAQTVGMIRNEVLEKLELQIENKQIIIYPGAVRHIKRRHPHAFKMYFSKIPEVIQNPDYIGVSSQSPKRIELVKKYKDTILVALKFDDDLNLFVSSMYIIEDNRVDKRIVYGRLEAIKSMDYEENKKGKYKNMPKYIRY